MLQLMFYMSELSAEYICEITAHVSRTHYGRCGWYSGNASSLLTPKSRVKM
jgi:hypothetical protein